MDLTEIRFPSSSYFIVCAASCVKDKLSKYAVFWFRSYAHSTRMLATSVFPFFGTIAVEVYCHSVTSGWNGT